MAVSQLLGKPQAVGCLQRLGVPRYLCGMVAEGRLVCLMVAACIAVIGEG